MGLVSAKGSSADLGNHLIYFFESTVRADKSSLLVMIPQEKFPLFFSCLFSFKKS